MAVKRTEWTFQGDVTHWLKTLCEEERRCNPEHYPFSDFDQDIRLPEGKRPDGVLYDRVGQAFAIFELKRPHIPAEDIRLLNDAASKAVQLGAKFIVTWNVNELVLWFPEFGTSPLYWQRQKWHIANIADLSQYPLIKPALQAASVELFQRLKVLYAAKRPEILFPTIPLDERFIDFVYSHVSAFAFSFAQALKDAEQQDSSLRRRLRQWFAEQQLPYLPDERRFWQGGRLLAYLLVNRLLFYEIVRQAHPGKLPPLKIPDDLKGDAIRKMLRERFHDVVQKVNFETAFEVGILDEVPFPDEMTPHLQAFTDHLTQFDYTRIPHDVVGRVYERLIPSEERHLFGQHFTRSDVVDFILAFCVRSPEDTVMDASCGAGTFLVRAYHRLRYLDPTKTHPTLLSQLYGIDIAKIPAHLATINLIAQDVRFAYAYPRILQRDFFDCHPNKTKLILPDGEVPLPQVTAFVGNPPYTRQEELEELSEGMKQKLQEVLHADFNGQVKMSKRAGIYAYFFTHGTKFLQNGGRIGLVTSNSWLDVEYGRDLQRFFLQHFKIIAIIEPIERWFEDAAVNTCITILERCDDENERKRNLVKFVKLKERIDRLLPPLKGGATDGERWRTVDAWVKKIEQTKRHYEDAKVRIFVKRQSDLWDEGLDEQGNYIGSKWGKYLRAPDVFFRILEKAQDKFVPLRQIADVRFGIKTGANEWFYLTDEKAKELGIEPRYLKPIIKSPRECEGIIVDPKDLKFKVILCHDSRRKLRGTKLLDYIRYGEQRGFHLRPTVKAREPWWDLGDWEKPDMIWSDAYHDRFACFVVDRKLFADKRFFYIRFYSDDDCQVNAAYLNSTIIPLFIECEGIVNLGEGAIYTNVYQLKNLLVPTARLFTKLQRRKLLATFKQMCKRKILPIFDEVKQPDRQQLDNVVLEAIGFTDRKEREQIRQQLYEAVTTLVRERIYRAASVQPKGKSAVKASIEQLAQEIILSDFPPSERKIFPEDFVSQTTKGQWLDLPTGEVRLVEGNLFEPSKVVVGEQVLEFDSPFKARFVAIAIQIGLHRVFVPDDDKVLQKALSDYAKYVLVMERKVDEAVQSSAIGKVRKALKAELMHQLKLCRLA